MKYLLIGWLSGMMLILSPVCYGQQAYWQQHVDYQIEVEVDVQNHTMVGTEVIVYTNNSPDTLTKVFYHLYFNAFQPGSMMDILSRTIADPDGRVGDRIGYLTPDEIGYHKIKSLTQDKLPVSHNVQGTILEVELAEPLFPGDETTLAMRFESQIPMQIRRSGRDNLEGISYSMSQWYPKLAEYDKDGWHSNPYISREFHGVWGDFEVKIKIDSAYILGATGYLQNPQEVGHHYEDPDKKLKLPKGDKLTWHFKAPNVHDFVWAADPDYVHDVYPMESGPTLHFLYQPTNNEIVKNWKELQGYTAKAISWMNEHYGEYPYQQYSVIQGGDGGMEYPMATLITGGRGFQSLLSVTVHELIHSWYYGVLATNESKYYWMDEGFTSYAQYEFLNEVKNEGGFAHLRAYNRYMSLAGSGKEEPLGTHADHFSTNNAYVVAAYGKGAVFLGQLNYIIGKEAFRKGMKQYYGTWKFKHPDPMDFKRVMEKVSGLELDWYFEYWLNTTRYIDYGIKSVHDISNGTQITLANHGTMPMPVDVVVTTQNGGITTYHIPLQLMRGTKKETIQGKEIKPLKAWPWVYPEYSFHIPTPKTEILSIEIDPSFRMADINKDNNVFPEPVYYRYLVD